MAAAEAVEAVENAQSQVTNGTVLGEHILEWYKRVRCLQILILHSEYRKNQTGYITLIDAGNDYELFYTPLRASQQIRLIPCVDTRTPWIHRRARVVESACMRNVALDEAQHVAINKTSSTTFFSFLSFLQYQIRKNSISRII